MTATPPIATVVVHYGDPKVTAGAVESIATVGYPDMPIWVVDNGPGDRESLREAVGAQVEILGEGENLGYGGGANLAIDRARSEEIPHVLLVSSDARFTGGAVELLAAAAESFGAGIVAPLVVYQDEETIWAQGLSFRQWHGVSRNGDKGASRDRAWPGPRAVPYVTGCVMLIRVDTAAPQLRFDPGFFLYYEDIDLCDRAHEAALPVVVEPRAVVTHPKPGQASHRFSGTQQHHMARSGVRYGRLRPKGLARLGYWVGFTAITVYRLIRSDSLESFRAGIRGLVAGIRMPA